MLSGLSQINIELTSTCNKRTLCAFCGHQNPAVHPSRQDGAMPPALVQRLAETLAPYGKNLIVQFHRDGDPLAAPQLGLALTAFAANTRSLVTHGETLAERAEVLIDRCEAITVSVFHGDPDRMEQFHALAAFLAAKGTRLPRVYVKVVGGLTDADCEPYARLGVLFLSRRLHLPGRNRRYAGGMPPMPEHGICLDLLHHPSVAWDGRVFLCNRLDPHGHGVIGDLATATLEAIWNGPLRQRALMAHLTGHRDTIAPCQGCDYYGIPAT